MKRRILDGAFLDRLDAASLLLKNPMTGYFGGGRKARSYGSTVEFADFREYFPGDDIRRIDWNVYARFENQALAVDKVAIVDINFVNSYFALNKRFSGVLTRFDRKRLGVKGGQIVFVNF